jgi:hypothetical protein
MHFATSHHYFTFRMKLITTFCILLTSVAFSQTLTPKNIQLYQTELLEVEQSNCDHFPFVKMDLGDSEKTFLIALCEYDITWNDDSNDSEKVEHSFLDLSLKNGEGQEIKPIGKLSADLRLSLINNPKYANVEAREKWGAQELRLGALFVVNKNQKAFTLTFAGHESKAEISKSPLPKSSDFAKVDILETELFNSKVVENSSVKRKIPEATINLSTATGKLLAVKVNLTPQAPNVMGGEIRYIFRPSDFMLNTDKQLLRPIGFLSSNFGIDTIYNISRKSKEELQKASQEITLIFAVAEDYQTGDLLFFGDKKGEVAPK